MQVVYVSPRTASPRLVLATAGSSRVGVGGVPHALGIPSAVYTGLGGWPTTGVGVCISVLVGWVIEDSLQEHKGKLPAPLARACLSVPTKPIELVTDTLPVPHGHSITIVAAISVLAGD